MIGLLLLGQTAAVTLDVRASSLERALPTLGQAYGVPMRAAPAIGHEIAVFSLRAVPLEEFKARVAITFAAEWRTDADGTLVLNRSPRLRAAEERAFFSKRLASAGGLLKAVAAEVKGQPPMTAAFLAKMKRLYDEAQATDKWSAEVSRRPVMPERRLMGSVLAGFRPEAFTSLSARTVYSSAPNAMQRPLPVALAPLLRGLEAERSVLAAFEKSLPKGEVESDFELGASTAGPVHTLLLTVETDLQSLSIELNGYDSAGRHAISDSLETSLIHDESSELGSPEASVAIASAAVTGRPPSAMAVEASPPETGPVYVFPASAQTLAYFAAMGKGVSVPSIGTVVDRNAARPFFDTAAHEPLSFAYSDAVFEAGRLLNRSVIARPPDDAIMAGMFVGSGQAVPLTNALMVERVYLDTPGWIVAARDFPYVHGFDFFPRAALRQALEAVDADPTLSLATAMRIAAVAPATNDYPPMLALPTRLAYGRNFLNLRIVRVFASLGEAGLSQARNGLRYVDLPILARERLAELVFGPMAIAIRKNEAERGFANPPGEEGMAAEPTLLLPNGIPPDARFSVTAADADGVVPADAAIGSARVVTMDSLATRIFPARNPKLFPADSVRAAVALGSARFRRSGREATTFRLDLTPRHHIAATHTSNEAPSGPDFTLSTLPPDLREAFDRAMRLVEERYKDAEPYAAPTSDAPPPSA